MNNRNKKVSADTKDCWKEFWPSMVRDIIQREIRRQKAADFLRSLGVRVYKQRDE